MLHKLFKYNCKHIESLLWEYAGGRLQTTQKARVAEHLAHCPTCQTQLQTIEQIRQGLETLRQARVPATQTNWADVQARLAAIPTSPQAVAPAQRIVSYRVLMGAGGVAAMALLWVALAPRSSEQGMVTAKTAQNRPSKQNMPDPTVTSNSPPALNTDTDGIAVEKSFLRKSNQDFPPYVMRSFTPSVRLAKFSLADMGIRRDRTVATRSGKSVRRHHFARRHGLLLARMETARLQQNSTVPGPLARGMTPIVVTLAEETPNYVLTGAEAESEPRRPRAYVMDCLSTDAKSQNGEERAW